MAKSFVEHKPCLRCNDPVTTIMIGPPATTEPHWLCLACYLLTPSGVAMTQGQIKNQLGEMEE